jgi:hypothetical protein
MRYTALLLSFLCLASLAFGQNAATDFKYGIKLSNQMSWNYRRIRDTNGNTLGGGSVEIFNVQPGFLLKGGKGNFWDFSLQNIRTNLNGSVDGKALYNIGLNVKVGYFYAFCKQKETHWIPMLGLELAPRFGMSRSRLFNQIAGSTYSTEYTLFRSSFGGQLYLTPRVMWCPGKRFFMDASLNIGLLQGSVSHSATNNPAASYPVRNSTNVGLPLDGAHLSLGFGLKL